MKVYQKDRQKAAIIIVSVFLFVGTIVLLAMTDEHNYDLSKDLSCSLLSNGRSSRRFATSISRLGA
jgi:hypothetical protein